MRGRGLKGFKKYQVGGCEGAGRDDGQGSRQRSYEGAGEGAVGSQRDSCCMFLLLRVSPILILAMQYLSLPVRSAVVGLQVHYHLSCLTDIGVLHACHLLESKRGKAQGFLSQLMSAAPHQAVLVSIDLG